jgi:hypothetical protein
MVVQEVRVVVLRDGLLRLVLLVVPQLQVKVMLVEALRVAHQILLFVLVVEVVLVVQVLLVDLPIQTNHLMVQLAVQV